MAAKIGTQRLTSFHVALGGSILVQVGGVVVLFVSNHSVTRAFASALMLLTWILVTLFAVRYRRMLIDLRAVAKAQDVQRVERNVIASVTESRFKASKHEYHQEQALERIEDEIRRLIALCSLSFDREGTSPGIDTLFVTSNGAGLGHITRLLAIAEEFAGSRTFEFLTLSKAYKQVGNTGVPVHYFPSSEATGELPQRWNRVFQDYFSGLMRELSPRVVVFDGTWVYQGVSQICRAYNVPLIWMQRGMWKPEVDESSVQRHSAIKVADHVIVPEDYAGPETVDCGPGIEPKYVRPIVRAQREDVYSRNEACANLELDASHSYVLLNLGGGAVNNSISYVQTAIEYVAKQHPEKILVQLVSPLSNNCSQSTDGVLQLSKYPISSYIRAFDFVISAAGYNSVQESVYLHTPTILVPNPDTKTDDQVERARKLRERGCCLLAESPRELCDSIDLMVDNQFREQMEQQCASIAGELGNRAAADYIDHIIRKAEWPLLAESINGRKTSGGRRQ